jgi:hypothetical protein
MLAYNKHGIAASPQVFARVCSALGKPVFFATLASTGRMWLNSLLLHQSVFDQAVESLPLPGELGSQVHQMLLKRRGCCHG